MKWGTVGSVYEGMTHVEEDTGVWKQLAWLRRGAACLAVLGLLGMAHVAWSGYWLDYLNRVPPELMGMTRGFDWTHACAVPVAIVLAAVCIRWSRWDFKWRGKLAWWAAMIAAAAAAGLVGEFLVLNIVRGFGTGGAWTRMRAWMVQVEVSGEVSTRWVSWADIPVEVCLVLAIWAGGRRLREVGIERGQAALSAAGTGWLFTGMLLPANNIAGYLLIMAASVWGLPYGWWQHWFWVDTGAQLVFYAGMATWWGIAWAALGRARRELNLGLRAFPLS
jgi:hypothetical protein